MVFSWLEFERDSQNVNVFMKLLFEEMGKTRSMAHDDKEFYKLLSTIYRHKMHVLQVPFLFNEKEVYSGAIGTHSTSAI